MGGEPKEDSWQDHSAEVSMIHAGVEQKGTNMCVSVVVSASGKEEGNDDRCLCTVRVRSRDSSTDGDANNERNVRMWFALEKVLKGARQGAWTFSPDSSAIKRDMVNEGLTDQQQEEWTAFGAKRKGSSARTVSAMWVCFWNNTTAPSIAESIAPGPAAGVSKRFRSPCPSAWHFRRTVRKGEFTELNEDERPAIGSARYRSQGLCSSFLALQERARRLHRYQQFADVQQRGQGSAAWCGADTAHAICSCHGFGDLAVPFLALVGGADNAAEPLVRGAGCGGSRDDTGYAGLYEVQFASVFDGVIHLGPQGNLWRDAAAALLPAQAFVEGMVSSGSTHSSSSINTAAAAPTL
ncbi:hypothetical protein Anapl_10772 [Anas platyrhynchos]|uniref:Uncharacterized protein n=1 Tax=Anas platyrhynchos TaxID=8839 RepID=R0J891_ANAPL|nr:hypothetical protein Anapl_10772 [Anas platyrhynchos]